MKDELPLHSGTPDKKTRYTSEVTFIVGKAIKKTKTSMNIRTLLIFIADGAPGKPIKEIEHNLVISSLHCFLTTKCESEISRVVCRVFCLTRDSGVQ